MKDAILIVDFGTSNVRAIIFDAQNGDAVASFSQKYTTLSPKPGFLELMPDEVFDLSEKCVKSVMEEAGAQVSVKALNFSFIGASLFPLTEELKPAYNCILCFDTRAVGLASEMEPKFRSQYTHFNDHWAPGAKILWLRQNEPEAFSKTRYFWSIQQYILSRLGLKPVWDQTMAHLHDMYDLSRNDWREDILEYIGITKDQVDAPVLASDQSAGTITAYGSVDLGASVPVGVGAHDGDLGMLGLGLLSERGDVIAEVSGTFDHLGFIADKTPERITSVKWKPSPIKDTMVIMFGFPTYGADVEWYVNTFYGGDDKKAYADVWANTVFDGSVGKVHVNPALSNAGGSIEGLDLTVTRYDIWKALIESLTFETRRSAEAIMKIKKHGCNRIRIGGGPAKSDEWTQLRADITGMTIERLVSNDSSALGSAVLASLSAGIYSELSEAVSRMIKVKDSFSPRPELKALYDGRYKEYIDRVVREE